MNKALSLLISALCCNIALAADSGSPSLKAESQRVIQQAGYRCGVVDGVYPAAFGGSVTVKCDNKYRYVIKNKDGKLVVEASN